MTNKKLSKTAQRGFLYLALIIVIVLMLTLWRMPKEGADATADTIATAENSDTTTQQSPKHHNKHYTPLPRQKNSEPQPHEKKKDTAKRTDYDSMYRQGASTPIRKREVMVELNSADTLTLQMINGIGPSYARRIVKYRDRLGGFYNKEQLMEVYGFTPELLSHIAPHITISTDSIRHIAINSATIKDLMRHPYIDAYQARDIVAYRNKGHRYTNADDLLMVITLNDSIIERILPYISFE